MRDIDAHCNACGATGMEIFFQVDSVPTNSCILMRTPEEALAWPRGRIDLGFCRACGFISNVSFDERLTEYSGRYEETQGFSNTFKEFHRSLAWRLMDRHRLKGKSVLEIGCGKGEFLALLSEFGVAQGTGFDPSFRPDRELGDSGSGLTFIQDFYGEKYAAHKADLVVCKMTLEHIPEASQFVNTVRRAIGDHDSIVFFQIPDAIRILEQCAFEDVYYEHCSYFSPGSLGRLFRRNGFEVLSLETEYSDQYLTIEARPSGGGSAGAVHWREETVGELQALVSGFRQKYDRKLAEWQTFLDDMAHQGKSVALWGSGSKAVAFLAALGSPSAVQWAVDINPHRQGHFMAGTGHEIIAPQDLRERQPGAVIVMNRIYLPEIGAELEALGLRPEVRAL